jgi:hypothetical protein
MEMKDKRYEIPQRLLSANKETTIQRLDSSRFGKYGRLIDTVDASSLVAKADALTSVPAEGNRYVADEPQLHDDSACSGFGTLFGDMPLEIGYCNGNNRSMNGMEYHQSPELFVAVTDCVQFLCLPEHLHGFETVESKEAEAFYFPKGTVALIDAKVMHLAPCAVHSDGFKSVIVLPKGTNEPLSENGKLSKAQCGDPESRLLFKTNKWMIAHRSQTHLIRQGVPAGLLGENRTITPV